MARAGGTLEQAILQERRGLGPLRELSDRIIDTSNFTAHQLRTFLKNAYEVSSASAVPRERQRRLVRLQVRSPGRGRPALRRAFPAQPVLRRLATPAGRPRRADPGLPGQTPITGEFLERLQSFLDFLIPHYSAEGKSYLTVAIGCTGGKHRSVALAEKLGARISRTTDLPTSVSPSGRRSRVTGTGGIDAGTARGNARRGGRGARQASARRIVGQVERLEAVSIDWNDDVDEATRRISEALRRVDRGPGRAGADRHVRWHADEPRTVAARAGTGRDRHRGQPLDADQVHQPARGAQPAGDGRRHRPPGAGDDPGRLTAAGTAATPASEGT